MRDRNQSRTAVACNERTDAWTRGVNEDCARAIVETAGCAIVVLSPDHRILEFNAEAERVHGYRRREVLGKDFFELFVVGDVRDQVAAELQQVLTAATPITIFENPVRMHAGGERVFLWNVTRLRSAGRDSIGLLLVGHDVTDRKRIEHALRESEERLRRARQLEAIGTQIVGIGHDLNNVMSVILAHLQGAMEPVNPDSVAHASLEEATRATWRAQSLIKQIFLVTGGSWQNRRVIHVHQIVEEALRLIRPSIPPEVRVRRRFRLNSATIHADPTQMYQVVVNLCTNAVQAMGKRGGVLDLRLDAIEVDAAKPARDDELRPGSYIRLTIKDSGHGIPSDLMKRIFDPFFTTKRAQEGIGMGLAAVQRIVRDHGGVITVESRPRRGTTFSVYLPVVDAALLPQGEAAEPEVTGRERILADHGGSPRERVRNQLAIARVLLRTEGARSASAIANALGQAQSLVKEAGLDLYEPFIRVEFAELARVTGDEAGRERELLEACRLFTEMGATLYADRISRELES